MILIGEGLLATPPESGFDLGCVKTLRGMTAPGILRLVVTFRAKICRNLSSAQHYDQIRFRFYTAWTQTRKRAAEISPHEIVGLERSIDNNPHRKPTRRPSLRSLFSETSARWCPALETSRAPPQ